MRMGWRWKRLSAGAKVPVYNDEVQDGSKLYPRLQRMADESRDGGGSIPSERWLTGAELPFFYDPFSTAHLPGDSLGPPRVQLFATTGAKIIEKYRASRSRSTILRIYYNYIVLTRLSISSLPARDKIWSPIKMYASAFYRCELRRSSDNPWLSEPERGRSAAPLTFKCMP